MIIKNSKLPLTLVVIIISIVFYTSCMSNSIHDSKIEKSGTIRQEESIITKSITTTPKPTYTSSPQPTRTIVIIVENNLGLNAEQMIIYSTFEKIFKDIWHKLSFTPGSTTSTQIWQELIAHVYIDPNHPLSLGIGYEDPSNPGILITFYLPINDPPIITPVDNSDDRPVEFNLLYLSLFGAYENGESYNLHWQDQQWVRKSSDGKVYEILNDQLQWEKTKKTIIISLDSNNPTKIEWDDLFGLNFIFINENWSEFGDEFTKWENIPRWENLSTHRLGLNVFPSDPIIKKNVKKIGFVSVTANDNHDYLVIVNAIIGNDGIIRYLKYPVNTSQIIPNHFFWAIRLESVELPMVAMDEQFECPDWTTSLPCYYDEKLLKAMEDFLQSGIVSEEFEKHPLMTSGSY